MRAYASRFSCINIVGYSIIAFAVVLIHSQCAYAQKVVPGFGEKIEAASDDFEDSKWTYYPQNPKSSDEDDKHQRLPAGISSNNKWYEGIKRGHPDILKRIDTPEGGPEDSNGSLLMQTLRSGIPNRLTYQPMQDDLVANVVQSVKGLIHVSRSPSVVCRVYFPEFEKWEKRTGNTFGYRIACRGIPTRDTNSEYKNGDGTETYWPGFFVWHTVGNAQQKTSDTANFIIRGGPVGQDLLGPKIEKMGWWTLGISCSPDGQIHYYAKQGVEDLTDKDWIASHYPYGYRCTHFETQFFNVINMDDGRSWSTPWVVDNAFVYYNSGNANKAQPNGSQTPSVTSSNSNPPSPPKISLSPSRKLLQKRTDQPTK